MAEDSRTNGTRQDVDAPMDETAPSPTETSLGYGAAAACTARYLVRLSAKWMLIIIGPVVLIMYIVLLGMEAFGALNGHRPNLFEDSQKQLDYLRSVGNLIGCFLVTMAWAAIIGATFGFLSAVMRRRTSLK